MKNLILTIVLFSSVLASAGEFKIKTKEVLKRALTKRALALSDWVEQTNEEGFDMLCLGESHSEFFRNFYAQKVLSGLDVEVLALESLQSQADLVRSNFVERINEEAQVTGVAINPVTDVIFSRTPNVTVLGVERTQEEDGQETLARLAHLTKQKVDNIVSRDSFIASHLDDVLKTGQDRVVALYGHKHCAKYATSGFGFKVPFHRLLVNKYKKSKRIKAVRILNSSRGQRSQGSILRAYIEEFDLFSKFGDVVIVNPGEIDPRDYNYNQRLQNLFQNYDVIVLESSERMIETQYAELQN